MEPYYDSDEGIGAGPMTLREAKTFLKQTNFINPRKTRRESAYGRLEQPNVSNSTEYFTAADSSAHSAQAMNTATSSADSSMENTNSSINDAVDEVIRTLDNESTDKIVIELSDDEEIYEESEVINISSSSSEILEEVLEQRPSIPKFKINSPTSNLREPKTLSANNSLSDTSVKLSDTQMLEELSNMYISHKGSPTIYANESFLLRSTSETGGTYADDEGENDVESVEYCTAGHSKQSELSGNKKELNGNEDIISPSASNIEIFNDHGKEAIQHDDSVELKNRDLLDASSFTTNSSGICENNDERQDEEDFIDFKDSVLEILEPNENNELFNSTLDRIDFILNSGGHTESHEYETPKRVVPVPKMEVPKSAPTLIPFKIPTKIPCSLRKELRSPRSRYENIKSPVAHYIKNSGTAPIIQNQSCCELSQDQFVALIETTPTKTHIQWAKITLPEKCYNRGEVQIVPGYKSKILKIPANVEALTVDFGGIKRHLGLHSTSRLPVPQYLSDIDLHGTLRTEALPREDISLITEEKVIID